MLSRADKWPDAHWIALDERGQQMTSEQLSRHLSRLAVEGKSHAVWFIGGPLGLSEELKQQCQRRFSLSALTFPHQLVPVILLEQLYRAVKIRRKEPYHY